MSRTGGKCWLDWERQWSVHVRMLSRSVKSDSLQPHGLQPTRPLCPWNSPGKNTGVGCHFLLQEWSIFTSKTTVFTGFWMWADKWLSSYAQMDLLSQPTQTTFFNTEAANPAILISCSFVGFLFCTSTYHLPMHCIMWLWLCLLLIAHISHGTRFFACFVHCCIPWTKTVPGIEYVLINASKLVRFMDKGEEENTSLRQAVCTQERRKAELSMPSLFSPNSRHR